MGLLTWLQRATKPPAPPSGVYLYFDPATRQVYRVDSSGSRVSLEAGSGTLDHAALASNLAWPDSGHTGSAHGVPAWDAAGAAAVVALADEQVLARVRGAAPAAVSPLDLLGVDRKRAAAYPCGYYNDLSGGSFSSMQAEGGSAAWSADAGGTWVRRRTGTASGSYAGFSTRGFAAGIARPKTRFKLKTGSSPADGFLWVGLFDDATAPTNSGTYTGRHAGVYATAAGGWVASTSDGTQETGAVPTVTCAVDTAYLVEIDCSAASQVVVRVKARGGSWYAATLSTHPIGDDTTELSARIRLGTTAVVGVGLDVFAGHISSDWL